MSRTLLKGLIQIVIIIFILSLANISIGKVTRDEEIKFGYAMDRAIISCYTLLLDNTIIDKINKIGNRIAKVSNKPNIKYTFRVVNDSTINAYSVAGGFVYINTGLLNIIESEDELAAVLAHEIAHINEGHQIKFIQTEHKRVLVAKAVGILVYSIVHSSLETILRNRSAYYPFTDPLTLQGIQELAASLGEEVGNAVLIAMSNGYTKKMEFEADFLAIKYLIKAGYNPNAMINLFKKLMIIRDKLHITKENYISNLINAEPGLEARIKHIETLISNFDKIGR